MQEKLAWTKVSLTRSYDDVVLSLPSCLQDAVIRRVDPGLGALLELRQGEQPSSKAAQQNGAPKGGAAPVAGYAHISAVSDKRVEKLEKVDSPLACCILLSPSLPVITRLPDARLSTRPLPLVQSARAMPCLMFTS